MLPEQVKTETEKEDVLGCCLNAILRLKGIVQEDAKDDDYLADRLNNLWEAFESLESHWDFYYRHYEIAHPMI